MFLSSSGSDEGAHNGDERRDLNADEPGEMTIELLVERGKLLVDRIKFPVDGIESSVDGIKSPVHDFKTANHFLG